MRVGIERRDELRLHRAPLARLLEHVCQEGQLNRAELHLRQRDAEGRRQPAHASHVVPAARIGETVAPALPVQDPQGVGQLCVVGRGGQASLQHLQLRRMRLPLGRGDARCRIGSEHEDVIAVAPREHERVDRRPDALGQGDVAVQPLARQLEAPEDAIRQPAHVRLRVGVLRRLLRVGTAVRGARDHAPWCRPGARPFESRVVDPRHEGRVRPRAEHLDHGRVLVASERRQLDEV